MNTVTKKKRKYTRRNIGGATKNEIAIIRQLSELPPNTAAKLVRAASVLFT